MIQITTATGNATPSTLEQLRLAVLPAALALGAGEPNHVGRILGERDIRAGHRGTRLDLDQIRPNEMGTNHAEKGRGFDLGQSSSPPSV